jgi:hypothetical protein
MTDTTSQSRPGLGVGAITGESFSLVFRNFFPMIAIMILPIIVMFAAGALLFGSSIMTAATDPVGFEDAIAQDPLQFGIMYALFMVIAILAMSFFYAAGIRLIFDAKTSGGASIGAAFSTGMSRMIPLFLASLVLGLLFFVAFFIVAFILGFVFGAIGIPAISGILIAVAGLYAFSAMAPFAAVVVVEQIGVSAITRALNLTKEYRWPIVGLFIVFTLAVIVIYVALVAVGYVTTLLGVVGVVLGLIVGIIGMVIIYGAGVAMISLLYARLREIKEGAGVGSLADVFS